MYVHGAVKTTPQGRIAARVMARMMMTRSPGQEGDEGSIDAVLNGDGLEIGRVVGLEALGAREDRRTGAELLGDGRLLKRMVGSGNSL